MKLYEILNIQKESCYLITPYQEEQERIKKFEIKQSGSLDGFYMYLKYEYALAGLLNKDKREIIVAINKLEQLLIHLDIINWDYNNKVFILAQCLEDEDLSEYCNEMHKLFLFYLEPVRKWIKTLQNNPSIVNEGIKKHLYNKSFLRNLQLFPHLGMHCDAQIKYFQAQFQSQQTIRIIEAQRNLWKK